MAMRKLYPKQYLNIRKTIKQLRNADNLNVAINYCT